ncbi:pyridoxamine 5'-phosphate oxidase family protein [Acaryochloris sp. IP29b_bin.148]|uniref:pyridoxamine 5'-phosphate oxidase family protein n=1 Tax=Acaryochloris sp. IP29b_bin.148 TaxID=2969218 RepID=UPI002636219D|nr:pyridoxamine 5'-phosphate oxidase family protein [Acaryochloris sp. IP29b_bin.148]
MSGWTRETSPFHAGEQAVQERYGIRDRMEKQGRRIIRDFLPEQHRTFYPQLPFLLVGSLDKEGRPWASIVAGQPGFISSPDPQTLSIQTQSIAADPLHQNLKVGADIGLLGIDLYSRRRNRMNGVIHQITSDGFIVAVKQTFGNCPQYIQKRAVQFIPEQVNQEIVGTAVAALDSDFQSWVESADTFFIATRYVDSASNLAHGVDVSHRGGKPGFVRVDNAKTLTFPDFAGNLAFNTIGNLILDPRVGLLFPNFQTGDLLTLTGKADVMWEGEDLQSFEGAERLVQVSLEAGFLLKSALPLQIDFQEFSPFLHKTGSWPKTV